MLSHFFLILFIFPYLQFTAVEFENFHCRESEDSPVLTINIVLILSNNNLFVALFCWFLACGVIIAVYAVGQKHCRQIGKARCFD